ncbi:SpaA isopeptide-forming pilin-related protein [Sporolactobacillus sp. STSJ-5]|uniref:SpaA isopeptide-forming pilin-related protein n=1 Tax=Sporolactobacillus sp. STSJ-5 TaxID=2965076 RepID=UPI002105BF8A|nr:SpaA isopeptide-forming pilin-related protein [Sporolactobacillus sp. STSJ-5]MCQ2009889.1 SpaA isopeptide-forming pilin-related protein [Sporolactobacillus sp. STSJ-5]
MQTQEKRVLLGLRKFVVATLFLSLIINGTVHSQKAYAAEPSAPIDMNHSLGVASHFNAFILNNMTMPNTDSEGRLAVGNVLNVSSYGIASKLSNNNDVNLVVGNELHYNNGELKGRFVIGENGGPAPIIDVSDYLRAKQLTDKKVADVQDFIDNQVASFAEARTQLIGISQSYQGYTVSQPNGVINKSGNRLTFSYSGSSDFVVFSLPSSEFNQAGEMNFDVPRGKTIIINITGTTINWPGGQQFYHGTGMSYGDSQATKIVFNFPDATTINLGTIGIFGSILAPKATVNANWGQLNGTLVANNFINTNGSMEVHYALFKPTLPPTTVLGKVTVKKVDATDPDKNLSGAEFDLEKQDGDSWTKVTTLTTGADGTISKDNLPLGTYRLVETKAPDGYEKGSNPPAFDLTKGDNEKTITVENTEIPVLGKLTVQKVDASDPDKTLSGAEFDLEKQDGDSWTKVTTLTTGADGTISKDNLPLGTYRLVETKAPEGYEKGENSPPFDLTKGDNEKTITVENTEIPVLGKLTVQKVDASDPDKTLSGAEFDLEKQDGDSWTKVTTLTTGADGTISKDNLPLGTYRLVETKAPDGYEKGSNPPAFDLTKGDNEKTVTVKNTKITEEVFGSVSLKKVDSANPDQTLEGAAFELQQLIDNGQWTTLYTLTTDDNGEIEQSGLELGTYRFVEKTAPTGYVLSSKTEQVTLTQSDPTANVTFENTKIPEEVFGSVSLKKVDSANPDQTLEGAVFELQQLTDNGQWTTLYTLTTDDNGEIEQSGLELGTYRLVETKAPTGYVLSSKTEQVTLTQSDPTANVTFENTKIPEEVFGSVSLKKVDSANPDQTLEGAVFELQQLIDNGQWTTLYTLTTDDNGEIEQSGLELGTYRFVEKTAPTGYVLSSKTEQVTLTQSDPTANVTFENTRIPETVTPVPPTPPTPLQPSLPTVPLQPLTPAVPTQTPTLERGVMGEEQVQDQPIASESDSQTPTDQVTQAPALQRGFLAETQYSVPTKENTLPVTGDSSHSMVYWFGAFLLLSAGIIGYAGRRKTKKMR